MPATLIAYAPVVAILGDFRFLLAFSLPATIALIRATGRRLRADETLVDVVTLAILLHPRSVSFTAFGWTEPLLVLVAAAFVHLVVKQPSGFGQATAFFLLPALKQYVLVPTLLYLVMKPPRASFRAVLFGLTIASLTVVPFLAWDWRSTVAGIVFQAVELKAPDSTPIRWSRWAAVVTGAYPGRWWSVAAQFIVGGIAYWRLRRGRRGRLAARVGDHPVRDIPACLAGILQLLLLRHRVAPSRSAGAGGREGHMVRGVLRSLTIALLTAMVALTAKATYVVWFCSRHQAWIRAHSGRDVIILNHQYGIPRATDAVFACEQHPSDAVRSRCIRTSCTTARLPPST